MDLSDLRKTIEEMSDAELQETLQNIRQNRRTVKPKAETKATSQKSSSMSLDDLLKSAAANPAIAAQLLAALKGGKK